MIKINGVDYEVIMYVEKKETRIDENVKKLVSTIVASVVAKILFDTLFRDMMEKKK